jgi:hypothetical protein
MAAERTTRNRTPGSETPHWAVNLLNGHIPEKDSESWDDYLAWKYFGNHIPGLPDSRSEKYEILAGAN